MKASFLVEFDTDRWRLARLSGGVAEAREVAGGTNAAGAVKAALQDWGYRSGGVCLGVPSPMVLAAEIDCLGLPRHDRHTAMLYRLEEQLPLDIEGLTADFLPPVGGRTLGVTVRTDRMREILGPLGDTGVETAAICPTALLACWQACQSGEATDYVIVVASGMVDIFRLYEKRPAAWYSVPDDLDEMVRCLKADHLAHPVEGEQATVCVIAPAEWPADVIETQGRLRIARREAEAAFGLATRAAARLLADGEAGWVNLCQGALAPAGAWGRQGGLVRSAVALGLVLLAALAAAFAWRAVHYADRADHARREQAAAYRDAFPNRPVPVAVKSRLKSELARLAGLSGASASLPVPASALDSLRQVVNGLPPGVRVRILELRVDPSSIYIDGQVRGHTDAESINRGLIGAGFLVDPPRTESLPTGGVAFTLAGKPVAAPAVAPPAEGAAP